MFYSVMFMIENGEFKLVYHFQVGLLSG